MSQLTARTIRKSFAGVEILHGADLDARGGSILALLGENGAGKSTLVKILAGDLAPDSGTIAVGGMSFSALTPITAQSAGIYMIHQELAGAGTLSVAENISLGRWPARAGWVNHREMRRRAEDVLGKLGVALDVDATLDSLRIGERQIVEIARALSRKARCLILDEPTAALSRAETDHLFDFLRAIKDRGVALIYITHRLDEVRELADEVMVLRDGDVVLRSDDATLPRRDLVAAMIGRDVTDIARRGARRSTAARASCLELRDATSASAFHGVNLAVGAGEVVGLYGKLGSGTEEILASVFGLRKLDGGAMRHRERTLAPSDPADAIRRGIGYLSADRKEAGAFLSRSAAENLAVASWGKMSNRLGIITGRTERDAFKHWHDKLSIRSGGNDGRQPIGTLSGGNQQKVLLARWLEHKSDLLLLTEPTRGVDVGARDDIYRVIRDVAKGGVGVLVATSDNEEVVQLVDRVYVMARGRVTAEFSGDQITTESLTAATGG